MHSSCGIEVVSGWISSDDNPSYLSLSDIVAKRSGHAV